MVSEGAVPSQRDLQKVFDLAAPLGLRVGSRLSRTQIDFNIRSDQIVHVETQALWIKDKSVVIQQYVVFPLGLQLLLMQTG